MPAVAEAHGLVQRQQLPIPQWLFAWAAAAVLVISFFALAVLWPTAAAGAGQLAAAARRARRRDAAGAGRCAARSASSCWSSRSSPATSASGTALDNWAPTFLLITFWVGMVFVSILFGDVYRAFSPFRAIGRLLPSLNRPVSRSGSGAGRPRSALFVFTWIELVSRLGRGPGDARHRRARLHGPDAGGAVRTGASRRGRASGEAFAVYYNMFARMSVFEIARRRARRAAPARRPAAAGHRRRARSRS